MAKKQHTNLQVFPTEDGDCGFMKAWSFHFLCKLVLILANSSHCVTEIGAGWSRRNTCSAALSLVPLKGKSKTKSKKLLCYRKLHFACV